MIIDLIKANFMDSTKLSQHILVFFLYSHLGFLMECAVLSIEKRKLVTNRGFAKHLPVCIIYGFGAMLGVAILKPFVGNPIMLFVVAACGASLLELITGIVQVHIFGDFWWDYTDKKFNYKGILCMQSTLGWGVAGLLVVNLVHGSLMYLVGTIPEILKAPLAVLFITVYVVDFAFSARDARHKRAQEYLEANKMQEPGEFEFETLKFQHDFMEDDVLECEIIEQNQQTSMFF